MNQPSSLQSSLSLSDISQHLLIWSTTLLWSVAGLLLVRALKYTSFCSRLKTFLFFKFYSQWHCILLIVFFVSLFMLGVSGRWMGGGRSKWLIGWLTSKSAWRTVSATAFKNEIQKWLECGPMPNLMVALPNIGGALCSTPQSLADAHY